MIYTLFAHAGSANHGCEAIVRSTMELLGNREKAILFTKNHKEDMQYGLDAIIEVVPNPEMVITSRDSVRGLWFRLKGRIQNTEYDILDSMHRNKAMLRKNTIALSIGGDNYCYKGIIAEIRDQLNALTYAEIPTVLWGCSIEEEFLNQATLDDLRKYSLITPRETLTQELLISHNVNKNVVLCCDPAFHLPIEDTVWNNSVTDSSEVIGINISAFMKLYEAYPNATYANFKSLIQYIINHTEYAVALIPHVVHSHDNSDLIPIKQLVNEIDNPRVFAVTEDYNCMQLKSLISKCKIFIGCRTHSTIAAYSSCVPTLVVGYSIKAKGIAKDLFGTDDGLVLPVQAFSDDKYLIRAFCSFYEREKELREQLKIFMPEYKERAFDAVEALKKLEN